MIEERRWVQALLILTVAMGMLDAISLLHLGTFTGYMTGTVILIGINVSQGASLAAPSLVALVALLLGGVVGGRLVRRRHSPPRLVADIVLGVAALVALAAGLAVEASVSDHMLVVAILGFSMGLQTSATRHAGVADMAMPAATMVLHGLAHDSRLAGGTSHRTWRRAGILFGLLGGAALGAILSRDHIWVGLGAASLVLSAAGFVLRRDR
ncbi:DUF1275 family protein [Lichenifustis flavocetrariae]|uniref:DUF1275 domain-containing protein n=1 Tax=Lichenifustis flavocetrariae TaxID=2949735 RepID=A0AA42CNE6_9HYPH|nr:DUF1275 family protein [Lichenifustis flavocetrariae]MCW6509332.1 DUF1275 domain-containing protein [Lichenifustis flavocetrariae]